MITAIAAAGLWGATDVLMGLASRWSSPVLATFWLHAASLVLLLPFLAVAPALPWQTLCYAASAGILASIGDVLFGKAMVKSSMSVGIPLANVIAAIVPVLVVFLQGESFTGWGVWGVAGACLASGLAALPSNGRAALQGVGYAACAGLCFGAMYAFMAQTPSSNTWSAIFVMRVAGILILIPSVLRITEASALRAGLPLGLGAGIASVGANALYIFAMADPQSRIASATIAVALSAPAAMAIIAVGWREQLTLTQKGSAFFAVISIALLAS